MSSPEGAVTDCHRLSHGVGESKLICLQEAAVCRREASEGVSGRAQAWIKGSHRLLGLRPDVAALLTPLLDKLPDVETRGGLCSVLTLLLPHVYMVPELLAAGILPVRSLSSSLLRLQMPCCAARWHSRCFCWPAA